jgi:hypothetical protein
LKEEKMGLFDIFRKKKINLYTGGDGSSMENTIIIRTTSTVDGVHAEYAYISQKHGVRNEDWEVVSQMLIDNTDGKRLDVINIKSSDGKSFSYYFNISEFFGKF